LLFFNEGNVLFFGFPNGKSYKLVSSSFKQ